MTGKEQEMMNTIHVYGLILSLDSSEYAVLERIKAALREMEEAPARTKRKSDPHSGRTQKMKRLSSRTSTPAGSK